MQVNWEKFLAIILETEHGGSLDLTIDTINASSARLEGKVLVFETRDSPPTVRISVIPESEYEGRLEKQFFGTPP